MTSRNRHPRLSVSAIGAAPPCKTRAPLSPLETGLAQDLRRLHEEPPDARLREDAARRHRPFLRIGLVRRGDADRPGSRWSDPFVSELCVLKGKRMRSCSPVTGAQIPIQQEQQRSGSSIHILAGH